MDGPARAPPDQRAPRRSRSESRYSTPRFPQPQRAKRFQHRTHALFQTASAAARLRRRDVQNKSLRPQELPTCAIARSKSAAENLQAITETARDRTAGRARRRDRSVQAPQDVAKAFQSFAEHCPDAAISSDEDRT